MSQQMSFNTSLKIIIKMNLQMSLKMNLEMSVKMSLKPSLKKCLKMTHHEFYYCFDDHIVLAYCFYNLTVILVQTY